MSKNKTKKKPRSAEDKARRTYARQAYRANIKAKYGPSRKAAPLTVTFQCPLCGLNHSRAGHERNEQVAVQVR